jgi:hypothetical protein
MEKLGVQLDTLTIPALPRVILASLAVQQEQSAFSASLFVPRTSLVPGRLAIDALAQGWPLVIHFGLEVYRFGPCVWGYCGYVLDWGVRAWFVEESVG